MDNNLHAVKAAKEDRKMRSETTKLLSKTLETRMGIYAPEVTLDFGTDPKRVDYVEFTPENGTTISGVERGEFTFYEVKSCKEDIYSGNGLNFYGDKNYLVMNMETYKDFLDDFTDRVISKGFNSRSKKFWPWYKEGHPDGSLNIGIMVAVPVGRDVYDEFEEPTEFTDKTMWRLEILQLSRQTPRKRSVAELLFCMLRAKHV